MAAAAVQSPGIIVSGPFQAMTNHHNAGLSSQQSSAFSDISISQPAPESSTKAFFRIRSSLEQTLRTATRSKKPVPLSPPDEFANITPRNTKGKEKAKVIVEEASRKGEKSGVLRRLESKVTFRRAGRESITPSPLPPTAVAKDPDDPANKVRAAGFTRFITPSIRRGSMSSPSLHLSSQALPSPKSRPAIPASSSSNSEVLVTPTRERTRRASLHPPQRDVSPPTALGARRESRGNGHPTPGANQSPSRHRPTKSTPLISQPSVSTPSTRSTRNESSSSSPSPDPQMLRNRDLPSPPDTPTPIVKSKGQLSPTSSRKAAASSGYLPLNSSDASSSPPPSSLVRARSPTPRTTRVATSTQRGLSSASTSHLPLSRASPSPTPRRPSIDDQRRPSVDAGRRPSVGSPKRPSVETPRRPSGEVPRPSRESPNDNRGPSPSPRLRAVSPTQRSYAQNRHFNMSSLSLSGASNPEYRELIRTATSMLCKEIIKIPSHMSRSDLGIKDWEEVEFRTQALARSERTSTKSGGVSGGSAGGEERERRLFCEALRDGFVLCQLLNKLRSASIVRPDVREDGITRTSNVTKFLAACSSYGLPEEDLFQRDDLIEATGDSLARVARTVIALLKFVESPGVERSKIIYGQGQSHNGTSSPYSQGGTSSRATASTPNLIHAPPSVTPTPPSPVRKRYSPPSGLPTVRSNSPDSARGIHIGDGDEEEDNVLEVTTYSTPPLITPPPKSPLRARSVRRVDDGGLSSWAKNAASPRRSGVTDRPLMGDGPVTASVLDTRIRESVVSSTMTETTMTTDISSILDFGRSRSNSNGHNKFGTIRTITTDATSEGPSLTRTEGSAIADELSRKRGVESGGKHYKDRKVSEGPVVDLSRVVEETESTSSSRGGAKDKGKGKITEQRKVVDKHRPPAINLGKGKWPDDFIGAFSAHSPTRTITPKVPVKADQHSSCNPVSVSPPRKLAIVGANRHNGSFENLAQLSRRRPTHPTRHSIDTPALIPRDAVLGEGSPDSIPAVSGRTILRPHSSKPGLPNRNGVHFPMGGGEARDSDGELMVPFPQTARGEPGASYPSKAPLPDDRPRVSRGRFRSDVDSSARRRARPSSYDELGAGARRSRIESMVNLGVTSSNASASDLLSRDSVDSSILRKALILREDGKPSIHFQLGNCIGRGQFGSVYRALNLNTGQMVAVKRIRLEGLKEEEVTTLMREVDLVKRLSHPGIVKYEGMARDEDTLSIVLEYAENGSLGQTLKAFGKLNERLVASYVVKILEGLHYLHQSDVVHCDLKAANILTTKNGNVKLSDFGVSLNLRAMEREIKDVAGTPNWMAPEVIELKGASTKSDIWSLACTVIELLTGRPPYAEIANSMSVMFRIVEDNKPPIPEGCSQLLQDFLTKCFNKDPTERPSAELLCEHPWLKKNWGIHKELRPQDSIPFLRRVSADLQKSEVARYLHQIEMPNSSPPEASTRGDDLPHGSPPGPSIFIHPMADNDIAPREHSFVKTTFSKSMICRVCLLDVKKSAVLCAQCSLIAHSKCAASAPPTCNLRAQLLLYAKYAEKGNPASVYSNPADGLCDFHPLSPASDVPYVAHSLGSVDTLSPPTPQPPMAQKFLGALKRSRSNLFIEPPRPGFRKRREDKRLPRKPVVLPNTQTNERPHSLTSNSTDLQSLRSAAESLSSRRDRRSFISFDQGTHKSTGGPSAPGNSDAIGSKITSGSSVSEAVKDQDDTKLDGLPGSLFVDARRSRNRESKSSGNCVVQ